jgi:hypothetical protein
MVNQDKTVIATVNQPSPAVFALFDTVVLLSQGKVVYHGKAAGAVPFFTSSPFAFSFSGYNSPGDFLSDVSAGFAPDSKGLTVSSEALCSYYKTSENYKAVYRRLADLTSSSASALGASALPAVDKLLATGTGTGTGTGAGPNVANGNNASGSSNSDKSGGVKRLNPSNHPGDSSVNHGRDDLEFSSSSKSLGGRLTTGSSHHSTFSHSVVALDGDGNGDGDGDGLLDATPAALGYLYLYPQVIKSFRAGAADFCSLITDPRAREAALLQAWVLSRRSAWALFRRRSVLLGTMVSHILLACLLGWIMGNSSGSIYNITSFFAVGTLLLVLGNIQLISFLFQNHQVYLKEHLRGLYSTWTYWFVGSQPLYLLRVLNASAYALIAFDLLHLSQGA